MTYLDTSALLKLYVSEPESASLADFVVRLKSPLPYTALHELEIANAIEQRLAASEMTSQEATQIRALIEADLANGILARREVSWPEVFASAIRLVLRNNRRHGLRSLDSLHVGCALAWKDRTFVTFDRRQASAATAEGLKVPAITP